MLPGPRDVFLCHTPFHLLVASRLAAGSIVPCDAVVFKDWPDTEAYVKASRRFAHVHELPGTYGHATLKQQWIHRSNRAWLRSWLHAAPIRRLYVANDGRPEGQHAIHFATRYWPEVQLHHFEDGSAAYFDSDRRVRRPRVQTARAQGRRLLVGRGWRPVDVLGRHVHYEVRHALWPSLARQQLRGSRIEPVPRAGADEDFDLRRLLEGLTESTREASRLQRDLGRATVLVLPDHPGKSRRGALAGSVLDAVAHSIHKQDRVVVKRHPRDDSPEGASVAGWTRLPPGLAAECVPLLAPRLHTVIGGLTGALLAMGWTDTQLRLVSTARWHGAAPAGASVLEKAGVRCVRDERDLSEALRRGPDS